MSTLLDFWLFAVFQIRNRQLRYIMPEFGDCVPLSTTLFMDGVPFNKFRQSIWIQGMNHVHPITEIYCFVIHSRRSSVGESFVRNGYILIWSRRLSNNRQISDEGPTLTCGAYTTTDALNTLKPECRFPIGKCSYSVAVLKVMTGTISIEQSQMNQDLWIQKTRTVSSRIRQKKMQNPETSFSPCRFHLTSVDK